MEMVQLLSNDQMNNGSLYKSLMQTTFNLYIKSLGPVNLISSMRMHQYVSTLLRALQGTNHVKASRP